MGLTYPDEALFNAVSQGWKNTPNDLPFTAEAVNCKLDGSGVTEKECRVALVTCLAKDWLQVIDEVALAKIAEGLREGQVLGPIYGLPGVGDVDFTHAGAKLWQRLDSLCFPDRGLFSVFTDVVHCKFSRFFRTEKAALADMEEVRSQEAVHSVTGPFAIGPWRVQWWRRFPGGNRTDIELGKHRDGRLFGEGEGCSMDRSRKKVNPQRLRHILDCRNVALAEWLLLAAMDCRGADKSASYFSTWVAKAADVNFGVAVSEDECRTGLKACLRYGWLRIMDQQVLDDVEMLLPVAGEDSGWGQIDFTPCGAALYRVITAEWLGPDWEDDLSVWKESYREEHHYSVTEEDLRGIVEGYVSRGEVVRASKIVRLGPWCVYWWERFPAGYRLELKIGES